MISLKGTNLLLGVGIVSFKHAAPPTLIIETRTINVEQFHMSSLCLLKKEP